MNHNPFKRVFDRWLIIVFTVVLTLTLSAGMVSWKAVAQETMTAWRDEFDSELLEPWYWTNENDTKWSLTEQPGYLRIYASPYGTGGENLLLRPVAPGDFVIKTHLIFEPNTNFQIAGLVIYQDENNFFQFGRAFCDVEGYCVGNGIYFDKILGDNGVDGNFATPVDSPNEAYLRLERRGEMVRAFYSYEEITWFEIGTHWIPPEFQVNAVGLTASQDFFTPDLEVPADFDFFELTEGWGFLPEGYHDYEQGDVPSWACNAGGWAVDPDDRDADLRVEINVDGAPLPDWILANEYRQDLEEAGLCVGGSCGFNASLWDQINSYEAHNIAVYAQDIPSGEWVLLSSSPKSLTCRTYDIYAYDSTTGETQQITDIRDADEYNPSWAPNGKKVAHDVLFGDGSFGIYITDLRAGVSTPLTGAENGNDAAWAPNFKWIAFDRDGNVYLLPAAGGTATLVREDAVSADWAPNGQRLVFQQPSDGTLRTIPVLGGRGAETIIAAYGANPSWSPDSNWIAYEDGGDIWKVAVNVQGKVFGEPVQVTSMASGDGQPTWSPDSQNIVFHSGFSQDYDLWTIPAAGGEPAWLTGAFGFGDYDPAYTHNGSNIAYSSFSPEGQAARNWGTFFTYDSGTWAAGEHSYYFENSYTYPEPGGGMTPELGFTVSEDAPRYDGAVLLRPFGIRARVGEECYNIDPLLYPAQQTIFHYGWVMDNPVSYAEAVAHFDSMAVKANWDEGMFADLARLEIRPWGTSDWDQFLCSATAGPPKMDLRVNYGHDWVESFYEAGHVAVITVTESDGISVKATATVYTAPQDFWGGETGFQTTPEDWYPAQPDIQPDDWVYATVDNGIMAKVQIGNISGMIDLDADSIAGTISAPWFSSEVNVECFPWGSPEPVEMKFDTVYPDGGDTYSCSWSGEWDIDYYQDVGVGYFGTDGHWVANAFFGRNPRFVVFPEWEFYDGLDWPDGAWVSISVAGKPECDKGVQSWGFFFNGNFPEGCDVAVGDRVTFTDGTTTQWHDVRNLAITGLDVNENTIAGTADLGTLVYVWPHDGWFEPLQDTADESGNWQVDLDDVGYDLMVEAEGRSEIRDDMGNATAVDWRVPNPRITASITENWFFVVEFAPEATLGIDIYEFQGGTRVWNGTAVADASGFAWIEAITHGQDLEPGNFLVVSDGFSTKELEIEGFTFDTFDLTLGLLQGTAPGAEGRLVWTGIGFENDVWSMEAFTDAGGNWIADYGTPVPADYWWVAAQVFDEDGDASELRPAQIVGP